MEIMNIEEKGRFDKMEQHIKEIQHDIANVLSALVGNDANGNKGFVHEISEIKEKQAEFSLKLRDLELELIKKESVVSILKWILGVATGIGIPLIIYLITK